MTHVDVGALKWLKRNGVRTFLDVGCSVGGQVKEALELGLNAFGLDGDFSLLHEGHLLVPDRIVFSDLTKTKTVFPVKFDAVWCVEVAEHVEEKYLGNLLGTLSDNLERGGKLVFTANDGPGINHVNLKPMEWWIETLKVFGLDHNQFLTDEMRSESTMVREFIRNTGIVCMKVRW